MHTGRVTRGYAFQPAAWLELSLFPLRQHLYMFWERCDTLTWDHLWLANQSVLQDPVKQDSVTDGFGLRPQKLSLTARLLMSTHRTILCLTPFSQVTEHCKKGGQHILHFILGLRKVWIDVERAFTQDADKRQNEEMHLVTLVVLLFKNSFLRAVSFHIAHSLRYSYPSTETFYFRETWPVPQEMYLSGCSEFKSHLG